VVASFGTSDQSRCSVLQGLDLPQQYIRHWLLGAGRTVQGRKDGSSLPATLPLLLRSAKNDWQLGRATSSGNAALIATFSIVIV